MAAKRHHSSKRMSEGYGRMDRHGDEKLQKNMQLRRSEHGSDRFNDEKRHQQQPEHAPSNKFRAIGDELYAGMEPRRRQEMEDAGYIHEDHNAIANLPQNVMIFPYPKTGPYMPQGLNDDIRGVDHQMDYDDDQRKAHWYPKKV